MIGYVKFKPCKKVIAKMKQTISLAKGEVNYANKYKTWLVEKSGWLFRSVSIDHKRIDALNSIPFVRCCVWQSNHVICVAETGSLIKIEELTRLNDEIMLDSELAKVYNSFIN